MCDDEIDVVENGPSVRVPEEDNPFAEQYVKVADLRLPLASAGSLYRPRISMKDMIVAAGWDFPCRVDEDIDGQFEVAVCEEGFLVRNCWHVQSSENLHAIQSKILARFGAYTVAYDVVCLPDVVKGRESCLRLIPWSTRSPSLATADETSWDSFNRRSDRQMLTYMQTRRAVEASDFALEALRHPGRILVTHRPRRKRSPRASRREATPQMIYVCDVSDLEARKNREPSRNGSGGAGSMQTLVKLGEEKRLVVPTREQVDAVAALQSRLPNFAPVIDYVRQKLEAQVLCANPMRTPPILLLGDAGIGKSYFCRMLAQALGMSFEFVQVAGSSQELQITGLSKSWGSAGPSRFAEILGNANVANPFIMVDEIDKASDIKVQNALLQIFEPETAARWVDQYVETPIDLSRVLFIATANEREALSPVLLSRFEVFEIDKPLQAQWVSVFNSIYLDEQRSVQKAGLFAEHLPESVLSRLIQCSVTPREARRLLLNAMEVAVIRTHRERGRLKKGCVELRIDDMPPIRRNEPVGRIGFI